MPSPSHKYTAEGLPIPLEQRVETLEQRVAALEAALSKDSENAGGAAPSSARSTGAVKCRSSADAWSRK